MTLQGLVEAHRRECGDRNTLAVHRVEGARRVADCEQSLRPAPQLLVGPSPVGGVGEADDGRQRFGIADRLVDHRAAQRAGEVEEARFIARRMIATDTLHREQQPIVLDLEHHRHPSGGRRLGLEERRLPVASTGRAPIEARCVGQRGVDTGLRGALEAELVEPRPAAASADPWRRRRGRHAAPSGCRRCRAVGRPTPARRRTREASRRRPFRRAGRSPASPARGAGCTIRSAGGSPR